MDLDQLDLLVPGEKPALLDQLVVQESLALEVNLDPKGLLDKEVNLGNQVPVDNQDPQGDRAIEVREDRQEKVANPELEENPVSQEVQVCRSATYKDMYHNPSK